MNYESMSDFEINKAVAAIDPRFKSCIELEFFNNEYDSRAADVISQGIHMCTADYCNNPSDAWHIVIENKISIEYDQSEDFWIAHQGDYLIGKYVSKCGYRYQYSDKNPLRAAMIVFLMMNES